LQWLRRLKSNLDIAVIFLLALSVSAYASIVYPKPIGADIAFHIDIARAYLQGQNGMFMEQVMRVNQMPYLPLFHMFLVPGLAFNAELEFIRLLQALLYPTCLLLAMILARQNNLSPSIVGLSLLGSAAYMDATLQVRPETLDILLWLCLIFFFLSNETKWGLLTAVLGIYNHSFASISLNGGELLSWKNRRMIFLYVLASLPIIVVSLWFLPGMLRTWVGVPASDQAYQFIHNWFGFSFIYLGALFIAVPICVYEGLKWKTLNRLALASLVTVASSLIMIPVWYDRFYHYASVPFALLLSNFVASHRNARLAILGYVVFWFIIQYSSMWLTNAVGAWDFH
jgi:hypothetical protein